MADRSPLVPTAAGRLSADIIASKLQNSQPREELCSFALLNLTWNSIVKLLHMLATLPDQPRITTSKRTEKAHLTLHPQAPHVIMLCYHAGFHVSRLLQLLSSYVKQHFDVVLEDKLLNQLKV